jgi:sRNA-binding protein
MPDRTLILEHLEQARRHVAEAERHVAHQREIIAEKERDGRDTTTSKQLLDQFEQTYRLHVTDRDRLEKELVEASK